MRSLASVRRALLAMPGFTESPVCPTCSQQVPAVAFSDLGVCTGCTAALADLEAEALARQRAAQRHQDLSDLAKNILLAPLEVLGAMVVQGGGQTGDDDVEEMEERNHQAEYDARYGDLGLPSDALVHPEYPADDMPWDDCI